MAREVTLKVYVETVGDSDFDIVWWCESDDVSGFYAAASNPTDLLRRAQDALREVLGDDGIEIKTVLGDTVGHSVPPDPAITASRNNMGSADVRESEEPTLIQAAG
jgi:hypothetical protein